MTLDPKALEAAAHAITWIDFGHVSHLDRARAAVEAYLGALPADEFRIGQRVLKHSGDYEFAGEVRGTITTTAGAVRVVVEHPADRGGLLHIYAPRQLRAIDDGATP